MMMNERGQISSEYLIVVGFVVFLILSVVGVSFFYSNSINDRIKLNQVENFAVKIIENAESVFYLGEPSQVSISIYLPSGVEDIEIVNEGSGSSLVFTVETSSGDIIRSFESNVIIEGDLPATEGVKNIKIAAGDDRVILSVE